jgi:hypothetical protein
MYGVYFPLFYKIGYVPSKIVSFWFCSYAWYYFGILKRVFRNLYHLRISRHRRKNVVTNPKHFKSVSVSPKQASLSPKVDSVSPEIWSHIFEKTVIILLINLLTETNRFQWVRSSISESVPLYRKSMTQLLGNGDIYPANLSHSLWGIEITFLLPVLLRKLRYWYPKNWSLLLE